MRSLWSARAGARFAQTAFALDAAVFDLAYITGPVLAGTLATGLAPAAALGLMLALTGLAVVIIGRQPPGQPPDHPPERRSRRRFPPRPAAPNPPLGRLLLTRALAHAAPSGSGMETQAWLNSIMNGGAAAGAAATGAVLGGAGPGRPILALALAFALALGAAVSAAIGGPSHDTGARAGPVR